MATAHRLWKGKTGGGAFGQWCLFHWLSVMPVRTLYPLLYVVIPFYVLFRHKQFKMVRAYFQQHHHYSTAKSRSAAWRNYILFGQVVLDKFAFMAGRTKQFAIDVEHNDVFLNMLQKPEGVFVLSAHVGNFELAGHALPQPYKHLYYVAYAGEGAAFKHQREQSALKSHVTIIPVLPDMSHLFTIKEIMDAGEVVAIPCDRLLGSNKKLTFNFLGAPADFPLGSFRIACQLKAQICCAFIMKEKGTHYRGFVYAISVPQEADLSQRVASAAKQYVALLEDIVRRYPEQWFNFYPFWTSNN